MDIEDYIEKIVYNSKQEDMERLSEILDDLMEIVKQYDENCYKEYAIELYKMAYGNHLNREISEEIVKEMRPAGMRWSFDETRNIQNQRGLNDIPEEDFFTVINSAYNDYKNLFGEDVESYVRFTIDFIEDEDAKPDKVTNYFL